MKIYCKRCLIYIDSIAHANLCSKCYRSFRKTEHRKERELINDRMRENRLATILCQIEIEKDLIKKDYINYEHTVATKGMNKSTRLGSLYFEADVLAGELVMHKD